MKYNRNRAILILMIAVVALLATSFYITPTTISDTDPSTYVVVPLLMLPLFILFTFKLKFEPKVEKKDALIGIAAFALFIALTVLLRIYFSFYFISFRIDLLLIPLAIVALVSMLFGAKNIGKFKAAMFYSLIASPAVMSPIASASGAFTQINTIIVYNLVKPFIPSLEYAAPITISANGYSVGIGQACVSMGIFIALAMFLIPLAYFYNGKKINKILWVTSGVTALLLLNIARMAGISYIWLTNGPSQTALLVHTFLGVVLFYAVMAMMILISRFYGFDIGENLRKNDKKQKGRNTKINAAYVAIAIAFSLLYLCLTLDYSSALMISPISMAQRVTFNFTNIQVSRAIAAQINKNNFSSVVMANEEGTYAAFSMWNGTVDSANAIMLMATVPSRETTDNMLKNNTFLGYMNFFNRNGTTEQVYDIIAGGTEYIVYNTYLPLILENRSTVIASIYVAIPLSELPDVTCSTHDNIYSSLLNSFNPSSYNQTAVRKLSAADCVSNRIVWS
jgi:exosortase/archaeosortase family protein